MKKGIVMFRTLSESLLNQIGVQSTNYEFSYQKEDKLEQLSTSKDEMDGGNSTTMFLFDESSTWTPENYNLNVVRNYVFQLPQFLFGERGIANKESVIGVALSWTSKSSNQRGIIPIASFNGDVSKSKEIFLRTSFKKNQLKGEIHFETVLYLKEVKGNIQNGYSKLAGSILGIIDSYTIIIDGTGSSFPIVEVSEPEGPLWWVDINWTDPLNEPFNEDYVSININTSNKFYKLMNQNNGLSNSPLMVEIISSALQIIIEKAKLSGDWESIESGNNLENGSIGQAIFYFMNTFEWDLSSSENLAKSIRKDLENRL